VIYYDFSKKSAEINNKEKPKPPSKSLITRPER
jgi:hypothetical protein